MFYKFRKNRKITRIFALAVILAMVVATMTSANIGAANGSIDYNNSKIDELAKKAAKLAADNKDREVRLAGLKNQSAKQQEFIDEMQTQVAQVQAQVDAYIELINAKQKEIDSVFEEIQRKGFEIENIEARIAQRELQIKQLDEENKKNIDKFAQIAAQTYMDSGNDAIGMLTSSTSFYDVLVRAEMIRNIGEKNAEFTENLLDAIDEQSKAIDELNEEILTLVNEQAALAERQKHFEEDAAALEDEKAVVAEEANRQYAELWALSAEYQELQSMVSGLRGDMANAEAQSSQIQAEIAELEAENKRIAALVSGEQNGNPNRADNSGEGFRWPLDPQFTNITCHFGYDPWRGGHHSGTDIASAGINGANIYAAMSGTVISSGWRGGYGNCVIIDHGGGFSTVYAHMISSPPVYYGQEVAKGQVIGNVGSTGNSTGPHLHYEIRVNGTAVNAMAYY